MKFKQGDEVVEIITGKVYIVDYVFSDGFITVSDEWYHYTDKRDSSEYCLRDEIKD